MMAVVVAHIQDLHTLWVLVLVERHIVERHIVVVVAVEEVVAGTRCHTVVAHTEVVHTGVAGYIRRRIVVGKP